VVGGETPIVVSSHTPGASSGDESEVVLGASLDAEPGHPHVFPAGEQEEMDVASGDEPEEVPGDEPDESGNVQAGDEPEVES
jgi:hypothetical protein